MSPDHRFQRDVAARQVAMFAMFVGPGLFVTRAALADASGIPPSTLREWAQGAAMPLHAFLTLSRFLPASALAMLTEPAGLRLVGAEEQDSSWSEVAVEGSRLVADFVERGADGIYDHQDKAALSPRLRTFMAKCQRLITSEGEPG